MTLLYAIIAGALVGLGVAVGIYALVVMPGRGWAIHPAALAQRLPWLLIAVGVSAGGLVWWITRWPAAGLLAGVVCAGVVRRRMMARIPSPVTRLEALENWVRRLADILRAGHGLEQAIAQSRRAAPAALAREIAALDDKLRAHWPTERALRAFANDMGDLGGAGGDLTVCVLILAARRRGGRLTEVLEGLAASLHDEVAMRRQVEAERAKPRATARLVLILTGVAATLLVLLRPGFLEPYDTSEGQIVLSALALAAAALWWWMRALATGTPEPRFLSTAGHDDGVVRGEEPLP